MDQNTFLSDLIPEIFDYQDFKKEPSNVKIFYIEIVTRVNLSSYNFELGMHVQTFVETCQKYLWVIYLFIYYRKRNLGSSNVY